MSSGRGGRAQGCVLGTGVLAVHPWEPSEQLMVLLFSLVLCPLPTWALLRQGPLADPQPGALKAGLDPPCIPGEMPWWWHPLHLLHGMRLSEAAAVALPRCGSWCCGGWDGVTGTALWLPKTPVPMDPREQGHLRLVRTRENGGHPSQVKDAPCLHPSAPPPGATMLVGSQRRSTARVQVPDQRRAGTSRDFTLQSGPWCP